MKKKSTRPRSNSLTLPYDKLTSMMYSVADSIQQRKAARQAKNDPKQQRNKSDNSIEQQQPHSDSATFAATGNTLNANLVDTSLRRNSYTPSNVSGAEFPETKSIKFKKQRTEEQLLDTSCMKCSSVSVAATTTTTANSSPSKEKDEQQQQRAGFLTNLQKFGQKRKPKGNALSAVKKDHQKNRPIRCSSCDILDAGNLKLSKQSSVQSNSSSSGGGSGTGQRTGATNLSTNTTCNSQVSSGSMIATTSTISQTKSSPIKTLSNPVTSINIKPSPLNLNNNNTNLAHTGEQQQQLQPAQLLNLKSESLTDSNLVVSGTSTPSTVGQEQSSSIHLQTQQQQQLQTIITTTTTVTQSITQSITQSVEHQPAEKRNSNESSSSTDTTTINSNTYSISTTTAATISGSLGKGVIPFQIDTTTNLVEENPIITITEHSPISSSINHQFFIGNSRQQNESHVHTQTSTSNCSTVQSSISAQQSLQITGDDQLQTPFLSLPIKRSFTDSNVCYFRPSETEALGTLNYITKSGQLCLLVILKAVHNISQRENVCTPRVCQGLVNILNELVSLGLLDHIKLLEQSSPSKQIRQQHSSGYKSLRSRTGDRYSVLQLFLDTCMNVFKHIGCEHGCNKQVKPIDVVKTRQELHALLFKLRDTSETEFYNYFQELVFLKQLNELVDIFHSYLGFCTERPLSTNISRESSRKPGNSGSSSNDKLTPINTSQPSSSPLKPMNADQLQLTTSTGTSSNVSPAIASHHTVDNANASNQHISEALSPKTATSNEKLTPTSPKPGANRKSVDSKKDREQSAVRQRNFKIEEFIVKCTFLPMVERLAKFSKVLNHNENLSTYCDIRQMLIFIKTYHCTTFRKATLNFLVECTEQLKKKLQAEQYVQQQKQQQNKDDAEHSESGGQAVNFYINDDPQPSSDSRLNQSAGEKQNRKSFFRRRNLKASSSQSITGDESNNNNNNEIATTTAKPTSESELPLIASTVNQLADDAANRFPSSSSFAGAASKPSIPQLKFDYQSDKPRPVKQPNTYILDMLKSKGEETFQPSDFVLQSLDNTDQSLSLHGNRPTYGWFKDRPSTSFLKSDQNNNQEKQINSDGVFVFAAGAGAQSTVPKESQTKIFTVGASTSSNNLYSGNTLAVAPITECRRSSFQSRTYLGKHLGFTTDFNGRSMHKARKAVEDQFLKIHLMSKRPGGPRLAANGSAAEENQATGAPGVSSQPQGTQPELSRKNSLNYLDMQNIERNFYHQQLGSSNKPDVVHKELDMISLKEGKLLTLTVLKNGVLKFSFLLESCPPGSLPDATLIAAVLSLKAPVIARAAFFLELANFVHNCNFGNWPQWMKQNFPILRNSGPLAKPFCRPNPRSLGQNNNLQRYAGRMFYLWGEAIASYLEEVIIKEKLEEEKQEEQEKATILNQQAPASNEECMNNGDLDVDQQSLNSNQATKSSNKQRTSKHADEEGGDDFLDDSTVNPNGNDCPYALKIAAVSCLTEITTYLRETHKLIKPEKIEKPPKKNLLSSGTAATTTSQANTTTQTGVKGFASLAKQVLAKDHDQSAEPEPKAEKPEKKITMTASRRWSMALSNLGLSQVTVRGLRTSSDHSASHSLKEKDHGKEVVKETSSSGTHSSSGVVQSTPSSHTGERRISFVIHEAEGENNSEHSSNTTLTTHEENVTTHHQPPVKRLSQTSTLTGSSRPNLLTRRGTGTQSISGGSGGQQGSQSAQGNQGSNANQPTINLTNGSSGSFKRRSIRLKKDSKSKRTSTLTEEEDSGEYGNGMKRTDSLRSRRKVSGISERSDTSDRIAELSGDESPGVLSDDGQQHQSHDGKFLMTYGKLPHFNVLEQDDQRLCSNMPWFKVVNQLLLTLDYTCKHTNGCSKKCYRKQMRSCSKLIKTVFKIYRLDSRSKSDLYSKSYEDANTKSMVNSGTMLGYQSGSGAFLSGSLDMQRKAEKKPKCEYLLYIKFGFSFHLFLSLIISLSLSLSLCLNTHSNLRKRFTNQTKSKHKPAS